MNDAELAELADANYAYSRVLLAANIDGELLAGVKIRAGDLLFDGSLRGQLATLSARLRKNT